VRGEHLLDGAEGAASELAGDGVGAIEAGIDDADEADRFALLFEFFVNAGVVASEDAHANHCDGNRIIRWQGNSLLAGCLWEPCIVNGKGRI
jgi:hypothetical protein